MRRVVVDTNVLVSAALNPASAPGRVVRAAFMQQFELVVSPRLIEELSAVLRRPKFAGILTANQIVAFVEAIEEVALMMDDPEELARVRDPNDDYLVALSTASLADALVSGDSDLLDAEGLPTRVLSPRVFVEELRDR